MSWECWELLYLFYMYDARYGTPTVHCIVPMYIQTYQRGVLPVESGRRRGGGRAEEDKSHSLHSTHLQPALVTSLSLPPSLPLSAFLL